MGVYYIPCVDVVWLVPLAFQEKLVKSPTSHNFADPILHNIVVKDIFAWVYLVSTEQITNRVSWQIIEIGIHIHIHTHTHTYTHTNWLQQFGDG